MAINTGINSLDAGAPELRLEGEQQAGGVYQQGSEVKNALAVWANMGPEDRAGFEGFLDFFRSGAWRDQIQGMRQMESNRGTAAQGGRIGLQGGRWSDPGMSPGTSRSSNQGGGGRDYMPATTFVPEYVEPTYDYKEPETTLEALARSSEAAKRLNVPIETDKTGIVSSRGTLDLVPSDYPDYSNVTGIEGPPSEISGPQVIPGADPHDDSVAYYTRQPGLETSTSEAKQIAQQQDIKDLQERMAGEEGATAQDYVETYRTLPVEGTTDTGTTDTGAVPLIDDLVNVTEDTGLTSAEAAQAFQESVEAQKAANLAASPGLPFEHYYVGGKPTAEQIAFMRASGAAPSTVGLEQYAARGGRAGYDRGGIANLRQPFLFGGIGKKLKKLAKSPIGKAAIAFALYKAGGIPFGKTQQSLFQRAGPLLFGKTGPAPSFTKEGGIWNWIKRNPVPSILGLSTAGGLLADEEDQNLTAQDFYRGEGIDIPALRKEIEEKNLARSKYAYMPPSYYAAQGGRAGYAHGNLVDDEEETLRASALASLPEYALFSDRRRNAKGGRIGYRSGTAHPDPNRVVPEGDLKTNLLNYFGNKFAGREQVQPLLDGQVRSGDDFMANMISQSPVGIEQLSSLQNPEYRLQQAYAAYLAAGGNEEYDVWVSRQSAAQGGRIGAQEGGLMDLGGMEKDYRDDGGFVPLGGEEKADDVPARLSKNEFVFTADAVRAAGGGDVDAGAEVMENVMDNLEAGGRISDESQGREGAQGMFDNAQRLQNRII